MKRLVKHKAIEENRIYLRFLPKSTLSDPESDSPSLCGAHPKGGSKAYQKGRGQGMGPLASTSLTVEAEMRHSPWGSVRYTSGSMATDFTLNDQKSAVSSFGLMYFCPSDSPLFSGRFTILPHFPNG